MPRRTSPHELQTMQIETATGQRGAENGPNTIAPALYVHEPRCRFLSSTSAVNADRTHRRGGPGHQSQWVCCHILALGCGVDFVGLLLQSMCDQLCHLSKAEAPSFSLLDLQPFSNKPPNRPTSLTKLTHKRRQLYARVEQWICSSMRRA